MAEDKKATKLNDNSGTKLNDNSGTVIRNGKEKPKENTIKNNTVKPAKISISTQTATGGKGITIRTKKREHYIPASITVCTVICLIIQILWAVLEDKCYLNGVAIPDLLRLINTSVFMLLLLISAFDHSKYPRLRTTLSVILSSVDVIVTAITFRTMWNILF